MALGDTANISPGQAAYEMGFPSLEEFRRAAERGRLMAAYNIQVDPEQRDKVEALYGVEFCRNRWPEAYGGK